MKQIFAITLLVMVAVMSGCAMGVGKSTTTEIRRDELGNPYQVVKEETPSFWKSENQEMAFKAIEKKIEAGERLVSKKLEAIDKARMERATIPLPPEARAYANALDMVMINNVRTETNVSDIPMPRNMAETVGGQAVQLTSIVLGGTLAMLGQEAPWLGAYSGGGSGHATKMEEVVVGGDLYMNGSVRKDRVDAGGYQATVDLSRPGASVSRTEDNDNYEGNAQSSNAGGDGDTTTSTPYSDDDSLL